MSTIISTPLDYVSQPTNEGKNSRIIAWDSECRLETGEPEKRKLLFPIDDVASKNSNVLVFHFHGST